MMGFKLRQSNVKGPVGASVGGRLHPRITMIRYLMQTSAEDGRLNRGGAFRGAMP